MSEIVRACACGRVFTREQWEALPDKKLHTYEWGEVQEARNCPCGSTIVIVLDKGETQEPKAGDIWKSRTSNLRIKVVDVVPTGVGLRYLSSRTRAFLSDEDFYKAFTPVRRTS